MIEVKPETDRFSSCQSCGTLEELKNISIRRSENVNSYSITLCDKCRQLVAK